MKKFFTGLFLGLLAIMFITCVYAGDVDQRFSLKLWLENFASLGADDGNLKDDLVTVWTEDYYFWYKRLADGRYHRVVENYKLAYEGDKEELEFLSQIFMVSERFWATMRVVIGHVGVAFQRIDTIFPWNATVTVTGPRGTPYV